MQDFGIAYLQQRIVSEFALARHIGIVVESADEHGVVLQFIFGGGACRLGMGHPLSRSHAALR